VVIGVAGLCAYLGLALRAGQLQTLDAEWLQERAATQHRGRLLLGPLRGQLRDREGRLLAASAEVESIAASPRRIRAQNDAAVRLARVLHLRPAALRERLRPDRSFTWIKRWVEPEEADRVRALEIQGVSLHPERKRFYPNRELGAAYLGFAGRDGAGLSGLELLFDPVLQGQPSELPVLRDAKGARLLDRGAPGTRGADVVLTLDLALQHQAEVAIERARRETQARHAMLIALSPENGDVLAVAESPSFDPNRFWRENPSHFRSRAFTDAFEPGSTLKAFTIAVALEAGAIDPREGIYCEKGRYRYYDREIRDATSHEWLTVGEVLGYSSNIGAAKIAARVGARRMVEGLSRLGFGVRTESGFPGEAGGRLRPLDESRPVDLANLAFGQGITTTALQLAAAGATLANGGVRVVPRLARAIETPEGRVEVPVQRGERVLSEGTAHAVLQMMKGAVSFGTGKRAALKGHAVAGKTGTAQKVVHGRYSEHRFVATFLGIVPADAPRLVVVVMLDEPQGVRHTGGAVAAPVFREVAGFAIERLAAGEAA
jgi:cell division protein FtsI (penicillin-binding protein 3)